MPHRLRIHDRRTGTQQTLIQSPFLFCYASLCSSTDDEEFLALGETKRRYLTGATVSSLYHLRDPEDGSHAAYFVFHDVRIRPARAR